MRLLILWLHLVGAMVWIGGLVYQAHAVAPAARRGDARPFLDAARRGRPAAWTAIAIVVLTGFHNVTQLGPIERVMQSGAGLWLVGKFGLVILAVALASQRDFGQLARLRRALDAGEETETRAALTAIAWLDRAVMALAIVIIYLGLAISRGS